LGGSTGVCTTGGSIEAGGAAGIGGAVGGREAHPATKVAMQAQRLAHGHGRCEEFPTECCGMQVSIFGSGGQAYCARIFPGRDETNTKKGI